MNEAKRLLAELGRLGVVIDAVDGQLRLQAPRGALSPELRDALALRKAEILSLLGGSRGAKQRVREALDLSLFFFTSEESTSPDEKYRLVLEGARFADAHGFAAVWTPERHFHPMGALFPNPSLVSVAVATATRRVGVRAGSVVLPLHDPLRVAEEWAVVDNLSRGRVGVSFASGWHANDFVFAPEKYADRKRHMMEALDVVRRLWRGEAVRRTSGSGAPVDVRIHPRPLQPELPFWLTAIGNAETFVLAGEAGGHLLTCLLGQTVEELGEKIASYRRSREKAGLDPRTGRVTVMLHTYVGEDLDEVRELVGPPFRRYLGTTLDLLGNLAKTLGIDLDPRNLSDSDRETLVSYAFDRYFGTSALIGTRATCLAMADRLREVGVDELACLVDFGLPFATVMTGLERLAELVTTSRSGGTSLLGGA